MEVNRRALGDEESAVNRFSVFSCNGPRWSAVVRRYSIGVVGLPFTSSRAERTVTSELDLLTGPALSRAKPRDRNRQRRVAAPACATESGELSGVLAVSAGFAPDIKGECARVGRSWRLFAGRLYIPASLPASPCRVSRRPREGGPPSRSRPPRSPRPLRSSRPPRSSRPRPCQWSRSSRERFRQ